MAESQNIEYKESWRDEYLKWICGFANAQGGTIYIGIDDSGNVVGVQNIKKLMEDIPNKIQSGLGIVADVNKQKKDGKEHIKQAIKIINPILKNEGLTRLGQSRLWVEDNGYFAIVFELQPDSYCDAVFFNVSVCFLWEMSDGLNEAITFNYGNRLYVEGEDRIFYDENYDFYLSLYLANAIERINKYRQFRDLKYACDAYASQMRKNDFWDVYCYSILNFLYGKYDKGITYFRTFLEMLNNSIYEAGIYIEWRDKLYQCCKNERYPALANLENPRQYVIQMIRNRRKILSKRKGFDLFANELPLSEMI